MKFNEKKKEYEAMTATTAPPKAAKTKTGTEAQTTEREKKKTNERMKKNTVDVRAREQCLFTSKMCLCSVFRVYVFFLSFCRFYAQIWKALNYIYVQN